MSIFFPLSRGQREDVSELRGYFMRHKTGSDVGFSWDKDDPKFSGEWERIEVGAAEPMPASDKHLPGWERGIATVTMNGHQLREALEFIAPGPDADPDELDNDLTFGIVQHADDNGKVATGLCCWNDDTDGVMPLDDEPSATAAPVPASEAANSSMTVDQAVAELNNFERAIEAAYPIPDSPHASVIQFAIDNRAAFLRGWDASLAAPAAPTEITETLLHEMWNDALNGRPLNEVKPHHVASFVRAVVEFSKRPAAPTDAKPAAPYQVVFIGSNGGHETHYFTEPVSPKQVEAIVAGELKPEDIDGWFFGSGTVSAVRPAAMGGARRVPQSACDVLEQAHYALKESTGLYSLGFNVRHAPDDGKPDETGVTASEYSAVADETREVISKALEAIRALISPGVKP